MRKLEDQVVALTDKKGKSPVRKIAKIIGWLWLIFFSSVLIVGIITGGGVGPAFFTALLASPGYAMITWGQRSISNETDPTKRQNEC